MVILQLVLQVVDKLIVMTCHAGDQLILREQVIEIRCADQCRCKTVVAVDIHRPQTQLEFLQAVLDLQLLHRDRVFQRCDLCISLREIGLDIGQLRVQNGQVLLNGADLLRQHRLILLLLLLAGTVLPELFLIFLDLLVILFLLRFKLCKCCSLRSHHLFRDGLCDADRTHQRHDERR